MDKSFNMSNDFNDTEEKHFDLQRHIQGITREKFQHKGFMDEFYKAGVTWLFNHGQVV